MICRVPGCAVHVVPAEKRQAVTVEAPQVLLLITWTAGSIFVTNSKA